MTNKRKIFAMIALGAATGAGLAWLLRQQAQNATLLAFDRALIDNHGQARGEQLSQAVQQRYKHLLQAHPLPGQARLRWHLTSNILPGLALYQVLLREHDNDRQAALSEVDHIFRRWTLDKIRVPFGVLQQLRPPFSLFRVVFGLVMKGYPNEGWDFQPVENSPDRIAFNATRCFYLNTLTAYGAPELTPAFCKTDDVMAEEFPTTWRFERTQTLGRGHELCDFRYCSGSAREPIRIPLSMSSVYLLPCQDGFLQIDTGYVHDYPLYRTNLAKVGIPVESIHYLLLTHHHDDHAGFLNDLARDTNLTIIAHEQADALLQGGANDTSRGGGYVNGFIKLIAGIKMRFDPHWTLTFPPFTLRPNDILLCSDDDQVLRQLGIAGQVLYTPGHCIDHLTLVLDSGQAFCGDAAANFLQWAGTHHLTVFMTDTDEAYRSWQKMLDAGAQVIYPAHGQPFRSSQLRTEMGRIPARSLARFF